MKKGTVERLAVGLLMVLSGYLFVYELKFVSFLMGLMLLGFTVDPRGVEDDLPAPKPAAEKAPKARSSAKGKSRKRS